MIVPKKQCSKCNEIKSTSQFNRDRGKKDGLNSWCKECHRHYDHFRRHKVTLCQKDQRYVDQDGKCQICSIYIDKNSLTIDRYSNDEFNLICKNKCKNIFTFSNNNIEILAQAKQYIFDFDKPLHHITLIFYEDWEDENSIQETTKIIKGIEHYLCSQCSKYKLLKNFYDGNRKTCSQCRNSARRKSQYGINNETFEYLKQCQQGVCAICRQTCKSGRELSVDHCHATGRVRGLLCITCNLLIEAANEDIEILDAAIAYRTAYPLAEAII